MKTFTFESMEQAYPKIIETLLNEGSEVSPRGQLTKEIAPAAITILDPRKRVISSKVRKLNYGFMCAELMWMLNGSNDLEQIAHYNSQWRNFSDDGKTLNGAYGSRIFAWDAGDIVLEDEAGVPRPYRQTINQFEKAYEQLKSDPDSRQATIVFFNPKKDYRETKDKPCTNLIRFMIRDGKLNMTTFMRSNDIMKGSPYDIFNFTMMQEIMAGLLGVEMGKYTHIADSLHIYKEDFEWGKDIVKESYPLLYSDDYKLIDARVSSEKINETLRKVCAIERITREDKQIEINDIINRIELIENEYWKSMAAILTVYNFRKYRRKQNELEIVKKYITNEFEQLMIERYNELN